MNQSFIYILLCGIIILLCMMKIYESLSHFPVRKAFLMMYNPIKTIKNNE